MRALLRTICVGHVLALVLVGCSMIGPDPSISVTGKYPITWSDAHEIEGLLPRLGIHGPIYSIHMDGPDRATVSCTVRPIDYFRADNQLFVFTVVRRSGRWVALGRPHIGGISFTA
jgi:hypothetical protein